MLKSKSETLSRSQILAWINRTLNINETRIENLGSGLVYCMLLNHFHPNTIPQSKLLAFPRSPNDYRTNLRRLQEGLAAVEIKGISFDVFKVSEMTYAENWTLVSKLHKHFNSVDKEKSVMGEPKKENKQQWWPQPRTFEAKPLESNFSLNGPMVFNPLSTPMKGAKMMMEEGDRFRCNSMSLIEQIKRIVVIEGVSDKLKVKELQKMLGLQDDEPHEEEADLKDLLSDCKKKQEVIQID